MLEEQVKLARIYKKMVEIRKFEEAAIRTYQQKFWKGSLHQCIGQEAIPAVAGELTNERDYFVSNHRGHGHILAKGMDPKLFMAELFGKTTGCCNGRGGSMHAMSQEKRVYPNGLVGSSAYVAAGIGMSIVYNQQNDVVICFFGDGAVNTGGFHEGMNLAAVQKVPVVFVCENNGIGVSTRISTVLPIKNIAERAASYGMEGTTIDGTDVFQVYESLEKAIRQARDQRKPSLIEAVCFRADGHTCWDTATYRTFEENNEWTRHDAIKKLRQHMIRNEIFTEIQLDEWDSEISQVIDNAVEFAKNSPAPELTKTEALKYVYA